MQTVRPQACYPNATEKLEFYPSSVPIATLETGPNLPVVRHIRLA